MSMLLTAASLRHFGCWGTILLHILTNMLIHILTDFAASRELVRLFKQTWGTDPTFACRAPGRVNIIGEHIDYHGYSVLPMATEADVSCGNRTVAHIRDCSRGCGIFPRLVWVGLMAGFCQSVGLGSLQHVDVCWCGQKNGRTRVLMVILADAAPLRMYERSRAHAHAHMQRPCFESLKEMQVMVVGAAVARQHGMDISEDLPTGGYAGGMPSVVEVVNMNSDWYPR